MCDGKATIKRFEAGPWPGESLSIQTYTEAGMVMEIVFSTPRRMSKRNCKVFIYSLQLFFPS